MNPNNNPWIDPNVSKFFNECVDREFRPNAVAREVESLREQQEYQFYQNQLTNNAEEYVSRKKLYLDQSYRPDAAILESDMKSIQAIEKYDLHVSNRDLTIVFALMGGCIILGFGFLLIVLAIFRYV
jgi:hypothetical protein